MERIAWTKNLKAVGVGISAGGVGLVAYELYPLFAGNPVATAVLGLFGAVVGLFIFGLGR